MYFDDDFVPDIDPFHQDLMDKAGQDIEEYCNENGYNITDLLIDHNEADFE